ncbi:hypothetical protein BsIDN1_27180 [Bacillus safensis]|uniref:Uncharacterized protein n=1 Tax=Bacillus safensis TaxID=561879 RepID=A0A5S9M681_BACIA|nr:hypothetical protein BsIDN1_27180 [Bacillus safensis]
MTYNSDRSGWALPNSKEDIVAPKDGKNVTLTIDQKIQAFLEESMTQVAKKNINRRKSLPQSLTKNGKGARDGTAAKLF